MGDKFFEVEMCESCNCRTLFPDSPAAAGQVLGSEMTPSTKLNLPLDLNNNLFGKFFVVTQYVLKKYSVRYGITAAGNSYGSFGFLRFSSVIFRVGFSAQRRQTQFRRPAWHIAAAAMPNNFRQENRFCLNEG